MTQVHSFDFEPVRVLVRGVTGTSMTVPARDHFEAEYLADLHHHGSLIDPSLISSIHIQVKCLLHGWQDAPWGFCEICDDNALDALCDLYTDDDRDNLIAMFADEANLEICPKTGQPCDQPFIGNCIDCPLVHGS